MGLRPQTPGTVVVLVGTVLLVLVSISTPIIKSFYFLQANVSAAVDSTEVSGDVKFGVFGYCAGSTCSKIAVGYKLDIDALFGVSGLAEKINLPNTLVKWLTYVLILHPVAAGLGAIATVFGLLSHIREFSITGFTTCFASLGATVGFIAFGFDIAMFIIAKKRIESSSVGGSATLGNALWMTLAGDLLLMFSGCFFGLGRCLIRNKRSGREASEANRPVPNNDYAGTMRKDALAYKEQDAQAYQNRSEFNNYKPYNNGGNNGRNEGRLPEFVEHNGEIIPLTSLPPDDHYLEEEDPAGREGHYRDETTSDVASLLPGVGKGYGRRQDAGIPVSIAGTETTAGRAGFGTAAGYGVGAGALLAARNRADKGYNYHENNSDEQRRPSTIEPFVGMYDSAPVGTREEALLHQQYKSTPAAGANVYPPPPRRGSGYASPPPGSQRGSGYISPPPGSQGGGGYVSPPGSQYDHNTGSTPVALTPPPQSNSSAQETPLYTPSANVTLTSTGYPVEKRSSYINSNPPNTQLAPPIPNRPDQSTSTSSYPQQSSSTYQQPSYSYGTSSADLYAPAPLQPPQQQYFVQNPSPSPSPAPQTQPTRNQTYSPAPSESIYSRNTPAINQYASQSSNYGGSAPMPPSYYTGVPGEGTNEMGVYEGNSGLGGHQQQGTSSGYPQEKGGSRLHNPYE